MSKKRFTEGLESIFGNTSDEDFGSGGLLAVEEPKEQKAIAKKPVRKSKSRKNFTTDLDSLFEDVLKETIIEQTQKREKGLDNKTKSTQNKTRKRKPLSGLDALIRRTVESSTIEIDSNLKKRVTFVFEKQKIDKLKKIARIEKAYLKDILNEIVSEYLDTYEEKRGNDKN